MFSVEGPVSMHNAALALRGAAAALAAGERSFSLARLEGSDSAALALLLELRRQARAQAGGGIGKDALRFTDVPASLTSFVALYGLAGLLPDLAPGADPGAGAGSASSAPTDPLSGHRPHA